MIEYAQDTSSRVLPLVQYIGQFSSIINWIAGGIKVFSDSRLAVDQKTTTKLRAEIAGQLVSLDLKFIVVMDDLDRLEPSGGGSVQACACSSRSAPLYPYSLL